MKYVSVLHTKDNIENRKWCSKLIKVSKLPDVNHQKNRELKRAAPDLFKKSRPDQQSSTNETVDMSQAKKSQVSRRETTQPEFNVNNRKTNMFKVNNKGNQNDAPGVVLVPLLLTLNIFHTLF